MPTARCPILPQRASEGLFAYPELRVDYEAEGAIPRFTRAFARLNQSGSYATSITRPRLFRRYLEDQLSAAGARLQGTDLGRPLAAGNPV